MSSLFHFFASSDNPQSLGFKFRRKRLQEFENLFFTHFAGAEKIEILDVGGRDYFWEHSSLLKHPGVRITLLNLHLENTSHPAIQAVQGDATSMPEFGDQSFDLVFSNSVIEHLFSIQNQQKMANEVKRVGKNYYIQTPNKFFPIEPHWVFPFFQFLPFGLKVYLTKNFNLGHIPKAKNKQEAIDLVNEVNLLSKKELENLFSESKLYIEKFMGFHKSYAVYKIEN